MNYAGFGKRLVAFIIDSIIGFILGTFLGVLVGFLYGMTDGAAAKSEQELMTVSMNLGFLAYLLANWLYFAGMESSSSQATLGKKYLGLCVADTDGDPINFGRATVRYIGKNVALLLFPLGPLIYTVSGLGGYMLAAFTPEHRALHDYIGGTVVLEQ
jgi:uncharacterized RDD family membrane protein YckC